MKKKPVQVIADCAFAAGLYLRSSPGVCLAFTASQSASWASSALSLLVFGQLIDVLLGGPYEKAGGLIVAYLGLIFVRSALSSAQQYCGALLQDKSSLLVYTELIGPISKADTIEMFDSPHFHDSVHVLRGLQQRLFQAASGILAIIPQVAAVASYVAVLWPISPLMPLVLSISVIPQLFLKHGYVTVSSTSLLSQAPEQRKLEYIRQTLFDPHAAGEIRFLGLIPRLLERYERLSDSVMDRELAVAKRKTGVTSLLAVSSWLGIACAVAIGVFKANDGAVTAGTLAVMLRAAVTLSYYLFQLVDWVGVMDMLSTDMDKLRNLYALANETGDVGGDTVLHGPIEEIAVRDVAFSYPGSDRNVLSGVDLTLKKGETVAVVGLNGAGKTTLVKLILGLYRPTSGRVLVNGRDLAHYRQADLRKHISCVFQDFGQYLLTIRQNVGFGDIGRIEDDCRILEAIEDAGAAEVVRRQSGGLNTQLGRQFGGAELSGGEWQKIALARCLLRDADLLILDEPSASLDVETEYNLYLKFREMLRDRMCVLISHRFSTVRMADRIIVLDGGKVAEQGTHSQLMDSGGTYANLYHQQADRYLEATSARV